MKIQEILSNPRYYHASDEILQPGTILDASQHDDDHIASSHWQAEKFLEEYRPEQCLPRNRSVFMTTDIPWGIWGEYGYEVQPLGTIERNDMEFFELVMANLDRLDDLENSDEFYELENETIECAEKYWAGQSSTQNLNNWEYRTPKIKIIRQIEIQRLTGFG
jgi:hypothetical protein